MFSSRGTVTLHTDPNPMLDEGEPTSTCGINDEANLCDALERPMKLRQPREQYSHGWVDKCSDDKDIRRTWDIMVEDVDGSLL